MSRSRGKTDDDRFDEPTSNGDDSLRWGGASTLAYEAAEYAKDQVASRLDAKMSRAARTLGSVAAVLRKNDAHVVEVRLSDAAERAADELERIADYVQTKSILDLVEDVEAFARKQPAVFLGSALVAGLLGGRFLKATTPEPPADAVEPAAEREERATAARRTARTTSRKTSPRRPRQAVAKDDAPRERAAPKTRSRPRSNGTSKAPLSDSAQPRESHGRKN